MKKFMFAAVVAFWSSVMTLVVAALLAPSPQAEANAGDAQHFTLAEVAAHDSEDDCWMVIDGKVYDFTNYLPKHPAALDIMLEWCGKEASEAYKTKGYGRPHSPRADAMMPEYQVGTLRQE